MQKKLPDPHCLFLHCFDHVRIKSRYSSTFERLKVRSRVRWFEGGERPTRYFFKVEHERVARNSVTSNLDSNDVEVFSREEIERAHERFYSNLFSKDPIAAVCSQICLSSTDKFLPPPQRDTCEGLLSLPESVSYTHLTLPTKA